MDDDAPNARLPLAIDAAFLGSIELRVHVAVDQPFNPLLGFRQSAVELLAQFLEAHHTDSRMARTFSTVHNGPRSRLISRAMIMSMWDLASNVSLEKWPFMRWDSTRAAS